MTLSGIEPATYQLVAQCLNQLCYRVPQNLVQILLIMQFPPVSSYFLPLGFKHSP
jgi:hypothetical protein